MNKATLVLAISQVCTLALAQGDDSSIHLEPQKAGAATYVCGGVGVAEQEAIKAQARSYDVMLTFAAGNGAYLADVDVEVRDTKGHVVLSAKCEGPIMLVDLPGRGPWRVTARFNGQTRQTTVAPGRQATLIWPAGIS